MYWYSWEKFCCWSLLIKGAFRWDNPNKKFLISGSLDFFFSVPWIRYNVRNENLKINSCVPTILAWTLETCRASYLYRKCKDHSPLVLFARICSFWAVISLDSKFMFAFRNLLGFSQRNASVVIQFYPWFKFYFLLLQTHYHILPHPKTKENKI